MRVTAAFSGPLPPPSILHDYASIHADFPERIVTMAEGEQKHRQDMEQGLLEIEQTRTREEMALQRRGQNRGFTLTVLVLGVIVFAVWKEQTTIGGILSSTLAGVAAVFVIGKLQGKEKSPADKELPPPGGRV